MGIVAEGMANEIHWHLDKVRLVQVRSGGRLLTLGEEAAGAQAEVCSTAQYQSSHYSLVEIRDHYSPRAACE